MFPRNPPGKRVSWRTWLLCALLLGPLVLAGCTGTDDPPSHWQTLQVIVLEPEAPATIGEPLEVTLQVMGETGVDSVGLTWANASTRDIEERLLTEAAFDDVIWTQGPPQLPAEVTFRLDETPDEPWLYVRGVAEKDGRKAWGDEARIATQPARPPLQLDVKIKNLPQETYWANTHTLRINATGGKAEATSAGFAWSNTSTRNRNLHTLTPEQADGSHATHGTFPLPREIQLPTWNVPVHDDLYIRPWVLIDGAYHWGNESVLRSASPPFFDHKSGEADHEITITPSLVPLPGLAAFRPDELQIQVGESVRWVNQADAVHSASRDENNTSFHTGNLGPGASSESFRFLLPGEYSYRCRLHPETMEAVLVVTE